MSTVQKKSLLFTLTSTEVDDIVFELELKKRGYEIQYLIDPYDVNRYCFPYGVNLGDFNTKKGNIHLLADAQIAYDYLFKRASKPILLDEYSKEIKGFHNAVKQMYKQRIPTLSQDLVKFIEKVIKEAKISGTKNTFELVKNNLSIIASISIGLSNDNIEKYNSLFRSKFLLLENQLDTEINGYDDDELFHKILLEFDKIISDRERKGYYTDVNEYSSSEERSVYKAKENAYNDALVILRTLQLNKENIKKGKKQLYFYVSSAYWTSIVMKKLSGLLPVLDGFEYSVHRTAAQVFANLIFEDENLDQSTYSLGLLKSLIITQENNRLLDVSGISSVEKKIVSKFDSQIEERRNNLENYGILLKHSSLEKEMRIAVERIEKHPTQSESLSLMKSLIVEVDQFVEEHKDEFREMFDLIDASLEQLNFNDLLKSLVLTDSDAFRDRNYGLDPVETSKQQLPVVFRSRKLDNEILRGALDEISYFYSTRYPTQRQIDNFKKEILRTFTKFANNSVEELFVSFLVYIAVSIPKEQITNFSAKEFYRAKRVIGMFRNAYGDSDASMSEILCEFNYVLVWTARRSRIYEEGLKLSDKFIQEYPDDPRFYHSRCLTIYSWVVDQTNKENNLNSEIGKTELTLSDAINSGEQALERYYKWWGEDQKWANLGIESLHNTLAHLYAENSLDSNLNSETYISEAKIHIDRLKDMVRKDFKKYPEYQSTEALVLFADFKVHETEDERIGFEKLNRARSILQSCLVKYTKEGNLKRYEYINEIMKNVVESLQILEGRLSSS